MVKTSNSSTSILDVENYFRSQIQKIEEYYQRRLQKLIYFIDKSLEIQNNHSVLEMIKKRLLNNIKKQPWRQEKKIYFKNKQNTTQLLVTKIKINIQQPKDNNNNCNQLLNLQIKDQLIEICSGTSTSFSHYSNIPSEKELQNNKLNEAIYIEDISPQKNHLLNFESDLYLQCKFKSVNEIQQGLIEIYEKNSSPVQNFQNPRDLLKDMITDSFENLELSPLNNQEKIREKNDFIDDKDEFELSLMIPDMNEFKSRNCTRSVSRIFTWEDQLIADMDSSNQLNKHLDFEYDQISNQQNILLKDVKDSQSNIKKTQFINSPNQLLESNVQSENIFKEIQLNIQKNAENDQNNQSQDQDLDVDDRVTNEIKQYLKKHQKQTEKLQIFFERVQNGQVKEMHRYESPIQPRAMPFSPYSNYFSTSQAKKQAKIKQRPENLQIKNSNKFQINDNQLVNDLKYKMIGNQIAINEITDQTPQRPPRTRLTQQSNRPYQGNTPTSQNTNIYKSYKQKLKINPENMSQRGKKTLTSVNRNYSVDKVQSSKSQSQTYDKSNIQNQKNNNLSYSTNLKYYTRSKTYLL